MPADNVFLDFVRRLRAHCGPDPDLDPVSLALAHAAVKAHHEVVGIRPRVNTPADLRDPQLDAVVDEHRKRAAQRHVQ